MTLSTTHHENSPSSLQRRMLCPGSARMERGLPDTTSPAASEGTLLHAYMAGEDPLVTLDDEQISALDFCETEFAASTPDEATVHNEYRMRLIDPREGRYDVLTAGTCDRLAIDGTDAHVFDWKFGRGETPPLRANLQLLAYASMAVEEFGLKRCFLHMVQPRLYIHESVVLSADGAREAALRIARIIDATLDPDAELFAGPDQCRYCKARSVCPVACQSLAVVQRSTELSTELSEGQLATLWRQGQVAKAVIEQVNARVKDIALSAGSCGGLVAATRPGSRKFTDNRRVLRALGTVLTSEQIQGAVTLPVGKLETLYIKALGAKDGKGKLLKGEKQRCKTAFAELLGDAIVRGSDVVTIKEG